MDSWRGCRDVCTRSNVQVRAPAEFPSKQGRTACRMPAPSDLCKAVSAKLRIQPLTPPRRLQTKSQTGARLPGTSKTWSQRAKSPATSVEVLHHRGFAGVEARSGLPAREV